MEKLSGVKRMLYPLFVVVVVARLTKKCILKCVFYYRELHLNEIDLKRKKSIIKILRNILQNKPWDERSYRNRAVGII